LTGGGKMDNKKCIDNACDFYVQDSKSCNLEGGDANCVLVVVQQDDPKSKKSSK
jgi:hypothetical protein